MSGQPENVGFQPASLLARTELLDHARNPRNRGTLEAADIISEEANPLCGDVVTVHATLASDSDHPPRITRMSFTGHGCLISQAAASLLTEHAVEKSAEVILMMGRPDVERLLGGTVSPSRVKCAMLPLVALKKGLHDERLHAVRT